MSTHPSAGDTARPIHRHGDSDANSTTQASAPETAAPETTAPEAGRAESFAALGAGVAPAGVCNAGSPVRIGPNALSVAALLTCAHYLPTGRAAGLFAVLTGMRVSTGFMAGVRRRAAQLLETTFAPHMRALLPTAAVLHADETTARAAGSMTYVHVASTEYLTLMHVAGRSADDIDAGGVLPAFTGTLMRDGYAGYAHLQVLHAWCAAHLLRDLRAVSDADPEAQLWAIAMADTLLLANAAATEARAAGAERLDKKTLTKIRRHYRAAITKGTRDNRGRRGALATEARKLISRFTRYEDVILRFATDLAVPFTNNCAERAARPVKAPATRIRRMLAHPARPHRLRPRAVLPRHRHQMGHRQVPRPPPPLHHRPVATTSPHPELNSYRTGACATEST